MITERRLAANRRNARASTGARTAAGKARVAQNARRHGLNVAVADDPALSKEAAEFAKAILEGVANGGGAHAIGTTVSPSPSSGRAGVGCTDRLDY